MKILLLAPEPFFQERGTPLAVRMLLEVLGGEGHQVDLLTYHEGRNLDLPGVAIHRIPAPPGIHGIRPGPSWRKMICDAYMFFQAFSLARKGRYQLVHAVEEAVFIALAMWALTGLPFIYDMDSSLSLQLMEKYPAMKGLGQLFEMFEGTALRCSVGVVAVCRALEEFARRLAPRARVLRLEDISLLDLDRCRGVEPPGPAPELPVPPGPWLMYVGNLEGYQGVDLMLRAWALAAPQAPTAQLVVIGGPESEVKRFQQMAQELGVASRTHLVGPRPQAHLGQYLSQAAALVSPRTGGNNTPMKIFSYLDSERPLLATRLATHTQVLDDEVACLVEPEPEDMARGMVRLLTDQAFSEGLAARAKERARNEHSYAAYRQKLTGFYRELGEHLAGAGALP
ncbi:MAG: glycosyltransferase [Deltaproteobacteria bacterium]|nr:glycosyltransferase [Deltaproteobacteria bacterium]